MKKIIIGLMMLSTTSVFAGTCTYKMEEDAAFGDAVIVNSILKEKGYTRVNWANQADHLVDVKTWRNPYDASNGFITFEGNGYVSITNLEEKDYFKRYSARSIKPTALARIAVRNEIVKDLKSSIPECK